MNEKRQVHQVIRLCASKGNFTALTAYIINYIILNF